MTGSDRCARRDTRSDAAAGVGKSAGDRTAQDNQVTGRCAGKLFASLLLTAGGAGVRDER